MNKKNSLYEKIDRSLQTALISLLDEKPYVKISVREITDMAGVDRSTFYLHYPDFFAILNDCLKTGIGLSETINFQPLIRTNPNLYLDQIKKYLEFCFNHPKLHLLVLKEYPANPHFSDFNEKLISTLISLEKALFVGNIEEFSPNRQVAEFALGGTNRILIEWLIQKPSESLDYLAKYHSVFLIKTICCLLGFPLPDWVKEFRM